MDYCYFSLENNIYHIHQNTETYQIISKYFNSSKENHKRNIKNIFKIFRNGESKRFLDNYNNLDNIYLLWHGSFLLLNLGSNVSNFMGILSQGLRILPFGNYGMFGNGIYFADTASKSIPYCDGSSFLFLCEVALGKIAQFTQSQPHLSKPITGKNSSQGVGKCGPDYSDTLSMSNGLKIPFGSPINYTFSPQIQSKISLYNNEFIVYDESQVKLSFLIEFN
jgi:poly [ADP-ribose] polymerase 2/3/4